MIRPVLLLYFTRRITGVIVLIWLALWTILVFFELLRGSGGALITSLPPVLLKSPRIAMEILPFACAIGTAIAMRRMVSEGAIPVLRTSGLSPMTIMGFQLIAALPFFAAYVLLSEVLLPSGADTARLIENKISAVQGLWLADNNDYIHVQKITGEGAMLSVVIYHTQGDRLTKVTRAGRADYQDKRWRLHDVEYLENRRDVLSYERQAQAQWALPILPDSFSAFTERPREMSLRRAMRASMQLEAAGQYNNDLHKAIWRRWLTLPALFLLTALGICFIGGGRQQRYAVSLPVLQALLVSGIYIITRDIFIQTATLKDSALLLAVPPIALAGYVFYCLRRAEAV